MTLDAVNLFSGAGGWEQGAQSLGLRLYGLDNSRAATATARVAGHLAERVDVAHELPWWRYPTRGLVASPPCQSFSVGGLGSGRRDLDLVIDAVCGVVRGKWADLDRYADPRTALVTEPLRWALELQPEWIALEQVPPVKPVWEAMAVVLRHNGYSVAVGVLKAEQFGVPQTRRRAVLVASRTKPARLPAVTHQAFRRPEVLGLLPWVSMGDVLPHRRSADWALRNNNREKSCERDTDQPAGTLYFGQRINGAGWVLRNTARQKACVRFADEPAGTIYSGNSGQGDWVLRASVGDGGYAKTRPRGLHEPAATVTSKHRSAEWIGSDDVRERISVVEASILQSFPADYPWQGFRSQQLLQIGNAIPPLLARAILAEIAS